MRISLKFNIIFLCMVAIPMFFVGTLIFNNARDNLMVELKTKLDLVANLEAKKISRSINILKTDLRIMQNYYNIKFNLPFLTAAGNYRQDRKYKQAKVMLDNQLQTWLKSKENIADLMLVSPEGKIVYSVNPEHAARELGKPLPDPENLAFELGKKGIHITEVFKNKRENNELGLLAAGPAHDLEGNFTGIIVLEVDMSVLTSELVERNDLGSSGETYLIDKNKLMISPSKFIDNAVLNIKVDTENARQCFSHEIKTHELNEQYFQVFSDYRGIDVLGTHVYIPELQWGLLAEIDFEEAISPVNNLRKISIIITVIVLLLVIIVSTATAQGLTKPIKVLQEGAEIIGKGNLDFKVATGAKDEIGQLSRAFDEMIQNLKNVTSSRDELNLEISARKRVEEKIIAQNQELEVQSEELQQQTEELQQQTEELEESNIELETQRTMVEDANRLKSEFLSNMSHELRTPLNSILALSRVVIDQTRETLSREQTHYLEIVERNGRQLLQLINDILDLSRIEAGYIDLNPKPFSLASIIEVITESLEPLAKNKDLKLKVNIPGNLKELESDETKVHQILLNIISNAVKFTEKGTITIAVHSDAEQCIITTTDTGIGIAEHKLSSIFQEFHQVDASSSRSYEGTGLGLAIARKSARILGGDITVESKPGEGSAFILTLPLKWRGTVPAVKESIPAAIPFIKESLPDPSEQRILVVDDQETVIIQVSAILEKAGFFVDVARGGREALNYLKHTIPDGIILDLMMPDVDGFDVLLKIRESKATVKVPVLVLTARDLTAEDLKKLKSNKIQQLIQKGDVDKKQLLFKVQLMLENEPKIKKENTGPEKESRLESRRKKSRTGTATVLIIEDNPDNLTTVKAILKDKYKLLEARDGEQGLKAVLQHLPDLVLLDMMLPKMDGFEVVKRIRADKKAQDIPVIALTARAMKGDREKILAAGCDDYLAKPVEQKSILRKIKEWLK